MKSARLMGRDFEMRLLVLGALFRLICFEWALSPRSSTCFSACPVQNNTFIYSLTLAFTHFMIRFRPVAAGILRRAVNNTLASHFSASNPHEQPSKEAVDIVISSANGDIRSALMALQFACVVDLPTSGGAKRGKGAKANKKAREGATRGMYVVLLRASIIVVVIFRVYLSFFVLVSKLLPNVNSLSFCSTFWGSCYIINVFYLHLLFSSSALNAEYPLMGFAGFGDDPEEKEEWPPELPNSLPHHLSQYDRRPSKVDPNVSFIPSQKNCNGSFRSLLK